MKNSVLLLRVCGFLNLFFLLFHLTFYWLFDWEHSLSSLNADTRNIVLTFNIIANVLLFYFTFALLRYPRQILLNAAGKLLLIMIGAFYLIRIFAEFYLWEFHGIQSWVIVILCAIPVVCSLVPLLRNNESLYARS
jgi:hypothetical protein